MTTYLVRWEIDIDAKNPEEAAKLALETQRDKGSLATVFDVFDKINHFLVDLNEEKKSRVTKL